VRSRSPSSIQPNEAIAAELRALMKKSLAAYKCPLKITFVAELPKTATGKLKRFLLREESVLRGLAIAPAAQSQH
jgi:acyl-coenzyme A synthetase/AMP-(fatty) acid ligase